MLYEGWTHDRRPAMGLALSRDGVQWQRIDGPLPDAAVLSPPPAETGAWDSGAIGTPYPIPRAREAPSRAGW